MVAPFMLRLTTMSAFLIIMPPTDMVMDFTAVTDLGRIFTAVAGEEDMAGAVIDGEAVVGAAVAGVETGIMRQASYIRITMQSIFRYRRK